MTTNIKGLKHKLELVREFKKKFLDNSDIEVLDKDILALGIEVDCWLKDIIKELNIQIKKWKEIENGK